MAFLTPCFVRVDDPAEREKLIEWMEEIGYTHLPFISESDKISTDSNGMIWLTDANRGGAYDCGTCVDLFRALAAMNDENDREQWFVVQKDISDFYDIDDIIYHKGDMFFNESGEPLVEKNFRKATAEEIVEYFKKK